MDVSLMAPRLMTPVIIIVLTSFVSSCFAQSNTATIIGVVTDPAGALVAGASVTVTNVKTGISRVTTSEPSGAYEVQLLPVGEYKISAQIAGFKHGERTGVALEAGQRAKLDFKLEVGDLAERITVNAAATLLSTQSAERGLVINPNQIESLPLNGRNFVQLISLQSGVVVSSLIGSSITF